MSALFDPMTEFEPSYPLKIHKLLEYLCDVDEKQSEAVDEFFEDFKQIDDMLLSSTHRLATPDHPDPIWILTYLYELHSQRKERGLPNIFDTNPNLLYQENESLLLTDNTTEIMYLYLFRIKECNPKSLLDKIVQLYYKYF